MPPLTEQKIRELIREELGSLIKSDRFTFEKLIQIIDGRNIQVGLTTGTKIGTAGGTNGQKIGFFNQSPAVQQTSGANLTNNVTVGGTNDVIANYTDLATYANDAATIRNDIYQLGRKLKQVNDGLRTLGLLD